MILTKIEKLAEENGVSITALEKNSILETERSEAGVNVHHL